MREEQVVKHIDPELEFVEILRPSAVITYKVMKNKEYFVLKLPHKGDYWDAKHIEREFRNLEIADNICGISKLVTIYEIYPEMTAYAILKTFIEGNKGIYNYEALLKTEVQSKLENTVRDLHKEGLAGLDLKNPNLITDYKKQDVKIIDLGSARYHAKGFRKISPLFNMRRNVDLKKLENIFREAEFMYPIVFP